MQRTIAIAAPSACLLSLVSVTLVWLGVADGGYFPPAWGWMGLGCAWVSVVAFALRGNISVRRLELIFVGGLAADTAWSAVSLAWTSDVTVGVQTVERDLVYVGAALVAVSLSDRFSAVALRNALLVGSSIVCVYSLATRLFPDALGFYSDALAQGRVFNPLGYVNAQGTLAAVAALLAAGAAAGRGRTVTRSVAAGLVPMLMLDCYFTLSRGALIVLAVGLVAWLALDPARLRSSVWLLGIAPWPAIAVWRAHGMTTLFGRAFSPHSAATGHRLAWQTLACSLAAVGLVAGMAVLEGRIVVPRWARIACVGSWAAAVAIVAVVGVLRFGTPLQMTRSAYGAVTAPPTGSFDQSRIDSLSLDRRGALWSVAWRGAEAHPIAGSGAGSFEQLWLRERTYPNDALYAHSLYLEVFTETGVIGLLLLCAALTAPIVAGIRARANPVVPAAFGAYVAYLVHAGVDWDWQVPALTLVAVWCGSVMLMTGDRSSAASIAGIRRGVALGTAAVVGVLAVLGLIGNRDLALSHDAATQGNYAQAAADASAAGRWQPWSYLPWMALGDARRASGDVVGARDAYREAIRRDSGRWDAWFALAEASVGSRRRSALREAERRDPLSLQIAQYCAARHVDGCPRP